MPAAKKYVVVRPFKLTDRRTGLETAFVPNTPFTGAVDKPYFLDPLGPDGMGPLIAEVVDPAPSISPSVPAGDSDKEKK